jgi:hypothetical protein
MIRNNIVAAESISITPLLLEKKRNYALFGPRLAVKSNNLYLGIYLHTYKKGFSRAVSPQTVMMNLLRYSSQLSLTFQARV